mgnify:CR=1 FL=1
MAKVYAHRKKFRIRFWLHQAQNKKTPRWRRSHSFETKKLANQQLSIYETIENKSKLNLASPIEVQGWIDSEYIDLEEAVYGFQLYRDARRAAGRGETKVDWNQIEESYEDLKLDKANSTDDTSETHKDKMRKFKVVSDYVKTNFPNLEMTRADVEQWLREKRSAGLKAQTRKHHLITLKGLFEVAINLQMAQVNPVDDKLDPKGKVTVKVPSRPKYIPRVLIPDEMASAILKLPLEAITNEQHYNRKRNRDLHPLCSVNLKKIKKLPELLEKKEALSGLGISDASLKRYISQGLLPQPSRVLSDSAHRTLGTARRLRWSMRRDDLIRQLMTLMIEDTKQVQIRILEPEHQTMRGAFPLAFRISYWAGLRNSEVVWLPWEHVDLKKNVLHVKKVISPEGVIWTPKSKMDKAEEITKERTVEINSELATYFKFERKRQESLGLDGFFVFPSGNPRQEPNHIKPFDGSVLNEAFQKYIIRAGFEPKDKLTFYSLRHTFCTKLLEVPNVTPEDVRDRMGHTDIRTTQTYMHPKPTDKRITEGLLSLA